MCCVLLGVSGSRAVKKRKYGSQSSVKGGMALLRDLSYDPADFQAGYGYVTPACAEMKGLTRTRWRVPQGELTTSFGLMINHSSYDSVRWSRTYAVILAIQKKSVFSP
jgi:hypothetical protein